LLLRGKMKTCIKKSLVLPVLVAALGLLLACPLLPQIKLPLLPRNFALLNGGPIGSPAENEV
jgi:hypothetical protein